MKILVIGKQISNKESGDYINIVLPLIELGHNIKLLDFVNNSEKNSCNLNFEIKKENPSLLFFIPVEEEIDIEFVSELSKNRITLAYFYDDTWRIKYSSRWVEAVNYFVTSDPNWKLNFKKFHYKAIFSPFFVNCSKYKSMNCVEKKYEISFVGQYHPYREWVINRIRKSGYKVKVFGLGWSRNSAISFNEMIDVFNESKINLNLSNCINFDIRYLFDFKSKFLVSSLRSLKFIYSYFFKSDMKIYEMVKARFFEINACGGFQIGFYAEGLEKEYDIGDELVIFSNIDELLRKIDYYINNDDDRNTISKNGYSKTIRKHDSKKNLEYIISKIII